MSGEPTTAPTTFAVAGRATPIWATSGITAPARLLVDVNSGGQAERARDLRAAGRRTVRARIGGTMPPTFYGLFPGCEPMLGPPHGGSPACNRALTATGKFDLLVPAGALPRLRHPRSVREPRPHDNQASNPGRRRLLSLDLEIAARLVAHRGSSRATSTSTARGSYDSSIPDQDRVISFLAADLDVYRRHRSRRHHDLRGHGRASDERATDGDPRRGADAEHLVVRRAGRGPSPRRWGISTSGRWRRTAKLDRKVGPWDELREPGQLMDDIEAAVLSGRHRGVRQLNHPYAETKLGRDQGFLRAIKYNPHANIEADPSFGASGCCRTRPRGRCGQGNMDWDVQEVMTGVSRADWLRYRALWFSLLSQGILRAGTANSDTHSLALEQVGYPRNLVFGKRSHQADAPGHRGVRRRRAGPGTSSARTDRSSKCRSSSSTTTATSTVSTPTSIRPWRSS